MRRSALVSVALVISLATLLSCGGGGGGDDSGGSSSPPPPANDWSSADIVWAAPYEGSQVYPIQYKKIGTMVHLKGAADAGSAGVQSGQLVCTLPEGYRPPEGYVVTLLCPLAGGAYPGTAGVDIYPDGRMKVMTVQQYDGQLPTLFLDGLSFSTAPHGTDGWTNDGMAWSTPYAPEGYYPSSLEFRKSGATVHLRGGANAGGTRVRSGQVIGTLPEGYRPPAGVLVTFLCPTWGYPAGPEGRIGTAGVFVFPDGQIRIQTVQQYDGVQWDVYFDGLSFSTVRGTDGWTNEGCAWRAPYTPEGDSPSTLEYNRSQDMVSLQGSADAAGTRVRSGQLVCTLPEGFRPPVPRMFLCPTWGWPAGFGGEGYVGTAYVLVLPNGRLAIGSLQQYDGVQQYVEFFAKGFSTR